MGRWVGGSVGQPAERSRDTFRVLINETLDLSLWAVTPPAGAITAVISRCKQHKNNVEKQDVQTRSDPMGGVLMGWQNGSLPARSHESSTFLVIPRLCEEKYCIILTWWGEFAHIPLCDVSASQRRLKHHRLGSSSVLILLLEDRTQHLLHN